jgi:hypothetical protein
MSRPTSGATQGRITDDSSTGRAGTLTAVDAILTAVAEATDRATVLTSDTGDLRALAAAAESAITVALA